MSTSTMPKLLSSDELSVYLDVPKKTLEGWRRRSYGPPFTQMGKHVRYREDRVLEWLDETSSSAKVS